MFSYLGSSNESGLFQELERMQRDMHDAFGSWQRGTIRSGRAATYPAVNIGATDDSVHVYMLAAGLDISNLDLSIQQNVLTIAGKRELPQQAERTYFARERFEGSFRRVITLPEDVDPEQVDANYRDGVLHITLKRRDVVRSRRIAIQ